MEVRAVARYVRLSPKKVQRVVQVIRGRPVTEAEAMLRFLPSRAARVVAKVLRSAVANAENNLDLDRSALVVARAFVDRGPSMKRVQPRARGRADIITRRSSHITVVVSDRRP
ncbi:MAG: 50S ribosomal protein L22 [Armatimonadota bacterium]|nr:50S ribosomal protein L22 [Armatimonadota bacterium]MDR7401399.1 50S ribosomal protein L22 [Armatimonadota bacterium]MDR7405085.1 50S ribosomal protein L22 [Armatimonadota bacterium]MDR7437927.1 50S ribosomal protein L22 [Armatimonadota bacterium]MDR7473335.1 50S ribosomal protein L22 [Armatimonadota bacterium]